MTITSGSISESANRLRIAIARTARRMRQETTVELTASQSAALISLDRYGPLTPSELAARERIGRPTATRLIAKLERRELVTRTIDPEDRRSSVLAITAAGHDLLELMRSANTAFLARRIAALDEADRATLIRASELLEQILEEDERR